MEKLSVQLFQLKTASLKVRVSAYINEEDDNQHLILSGSDSGSTVKKLRGTSEYDYYLIINRVNKDLLIQRLNIKNYSIHSDLELLHWIQENYSDNEGFSRFRKFLDRNDVESRMDIW